MERGDPAGREEGKTKSTKKRNKNMRHYSKQILAAERGHIKLNRYGTSQALAQTPWAVWS
jgi:hypothetical protein